jgi:hypothetical protein
LTSEATPLDPWNQPFIYRKPSERPNHDYDLCSNGGNAEADKRRKVLEGELNTKLAAAEQQIVPLSSRGWGRPPPLLIPADKPQHSLL